MLKLAVICVWIHIHIVNGHWSNYFSSSRQSPNANIEWLYARLPPSLCGMGASPDTFIPVDGVGCRGQHCTFSRLLGAGDSSVRYLVCHLSI